MIGPWMHPAESGMVTGRLAEAVRSVTSGLVHVRTLYPSGRFVVSIYAFLEDR